jgi:hypothetical protein
MDLVNNKVYPHIERLDGLQEISEFMGISLSQLQRYSRTLQEYGVLLTRTVWVRVPGYNRKKPQRIVYTYKFLIINYLSALEKAKHNLC